MQISNISGTRAGGQYQPTQAYTYPDADTWSVFENSALWKEILAHTPFTQEQAWSNFTGYTDLSSISSLEDFLQKFFYSMEGYMTDIPNIKKNWADAIRQRYSDSLDTQLEEWGVTLGKNQKTLFFNQAFEKYLEKVSKGQISGITNLQTFFEGFDDYCATAFIGDQETYENSLILLAAMFPDKADQAALLPDLEKLFTKYMRDSIDGSIDGDALLDEWSDFLSSELLKRAGFDVKNPSEVKDKTMIIMAIYALLRELVGESQLLTAAQAERQNCLLQFDRAWNNLIATIGGTNEAGQTSRNIPKGTDAEKTTELKGDIQMAEQRWRENALAEQSMVQDVLKQAQTTLSQSTESTNQAGNIIAQIIQLLQGLLAALWR